MPVIQEDDIVQCGSFYAIWPEIREKFKKFIKSAKRNGALILYDPNFRSTHLSDLESLRPFILENMALASIVRGSDEDFRNIFGAADHEEAWDEVKRYCNCLVYTANTDGVYVRTPAFSGKYPVRQITPVSTIGAGDNFNAGMITSIYRNNIKRDQLVKLGEKDWSELIGTAVSFATHVCLCYENYISHEFASGMASKH